MQSNTQPTLDLFAKPQVTAFITFVIVAALGAAAKTTGVPVPESAVGTVVVAFFTVFLGALAEKKVKGEGYVGSFKQFLFSKKNMAAFAGLFVVVASAALAPLGFSLPEETLTQIGVFVIGTVAALAGIDVKQVMDEGGKQ